jgi:hypothetical protein
LSWISLSGTQSLASTELTLEEEEEEEEEENWELSWTPLSGTQS